VSFSNCALPITLTDDYLRRGALNLTSISQERCTVDRDRFTQKVTKASLVHL
jgi:hypothetical protein